MDLSIVVPCYNEAVGIEKFYEVTTEVLKQEKIKYELIIVDDGSSDDTYLRLSEICKKDKKVKVVCLSKNFGKEAAMLAGLKHTSGKYISIMDADLQHTPEMLLLMYNKLLENKDFDVVASYKEKRKDEPALKRTLTSLFYRINNKISEAKLLPGASDFRVFKEEVKDAIISLPENTRFLKGIFSWIGFNTIYVPYTPEKRVFGNSHWSLFKLIKYSISGIISFSTFPLKTIFVLGIFMFIVSLLNYLLMGHLSSRSIMLLLGLVMLSVGIIALYISNAYNTILRRPNYIIKSKIGFDK